MHTEKPAKKIKIATIKKGMIDNASGYSLRGKPVYIADVMHTLIVY